MADKLVLTLILDPETGDIECQGPIGNKTVCYAMLELAKDAIRSCHARKEALEAIAQPSAQDIASISRFRNGRHAG